MANKWFYAVTWVNGVKGGCGPFETYEEADSSRDQYVVDTPDATVGEPFQTDENYEFPRPKAVISRGNGTEYMLYSDGSTSDLT